MCKMYYQEAFSVRTAMMLVLCMRCRRMQAGLANGGLAAGATLQLTSPRVASKPTVLGLDLYVKRCVC